MSKRHRLAIVVSHPIQYYVPLYRALAADGSVELKVFFASQIGLKPLLDPDMGVEIAWAMDLTGGFDHEYMPGAETKARTGFREIDNPVGAALRRFGPDVVIVHGYAMLTMLRAIAWCRIRGVPLILASDSSADTGGSGLRRRLKKVVLPWLLGRFCAFLTMSDRAETYWRGLGILPARLFRVPMMLPEGFRLSLGSARTRLEVRRSLGFGEDDIVLICVGKLHAGKRTADIIRAVGQMSVGDGEIGQLALLVVGDGDQRFELQELSKALASRAVFTGFCNLDSLPGLYAAADRFVHAASGEPYGVVVLEAAAAGLPLVVSDEVGAVGVGSIARPCENAVTFPCGDVDALTDALTRLALDPDLRRRMGVRSLELAASHTGSESVRGVLRAVEHCTREDA